MNTNHHPGHHLTTLLYHHEASGVQKARFAHRYGVRGSGYGVRCLAVRKRADSHTGTGLAVSRCVKGSICTPERGSGFRNSRRAKGSICTPLRGYRSRGVQKVRFAHRDGGSGSCTLTRWCVQVLMDSIPELWLRTHGID